MRPRPPGFLLKPELGWSEPDVGHVVYLMWAMRALSGAEISVDFGVASVASRACCFCDRWKRDWSRRLDRSAAHKSDVRDLPRSGAERCHLTCDKTYLCGAVSRLRPGCSSGRADSVE